MRGVKPRIKKVFEKVMENGGTGIGKAMIEQGYSPNSAKTPQKLTETKGWKALMKEVLPNDLLVRVAKEGLEATKPIGALVLINNDESGKPKQILKDNEGMIEVADYPTRQKYLETALKMRGKLVEKTDLTTKGKKIETNTIMFTDFKNDSKS